MTPTSAGRVQCVPYGRTKGIGSVVPQLQLRNCLQGYWKLVALRSVTVYVCCQVMLQYKVFSGIINSVIPIISSLVNSAILR